MDLEVYAILNKKMKEAGGVPGKDGITPNIQIGTVTTLESNEQATVENVGTKENPIFNFGIPKGQDGTGGGSVSIDDTTLSTDKTWSSSKIEDFVLNNDNTVWLDQNGENLKLDNTKEGYLREVEIWGNTIQNEEDLSDIQHLGELYVDDEGQPILDDLGREQYKVEIGVTNANYNLYNLSNVAEKKDIDSVGNLVDAPSDSICLDFIPVKSGDKIFASGGMWKKIIGYDQNKNYVKRIYDSSSGTNIVLIPEGISFIRLGCGISVISNIKSNKIMFTFGDKQLDYQENYISYQDRKSHKTTILLPCQLMKVGDVCDRLYWDEEKGKYVVEKNIGESEVTTVRGYYKKTIEDIDYAYFWQLNINFCVNNVKKQSKVNAIIENMKYYNDNNNMVNGLIEESYFTSLGYTLDNNGVNKYISDNPTKFYYATSQAPQLIETNITEQIKLPTYLNTTYITINGGIQGSIKFKAPVDGSAVLNTLVQENKELKAVNEVQDGLIDITMMATDEMFMMLEPLLVNAVSLSSESKMVDMYVAMIQRGLKKEDEIPERYKEQVKELLKK